MSTRMTSAKDELLLDLTMETATVLREVRESLEQEYDGKVASVNAQILEAEKTAASSAIEKLIKKHPGACKVFSGGGGGIKGLAKKAKKLKNAVQKMDSKTEKERKTAGAVVLTTILFFAGYPLAGFTGPWLADANWKILKWQGKQVYKAMDWLLKNAEDVGSGIKDLCKDVKPALPDKMEKVMKESK